MLIKIIIPNLRILFLTSNWTKFISLIHWNKISKDTKYIRLVFSKKIKLFDIMKKIKKENRAKKNL